jgi:PAS domain S-box-containing protein
MRSADLAPVNLGRQLPEYFGFHVVLGVGLLSAYFPFRRQLEVPHLSSTFGVLEVLWPVGMFLAMVLFARYLYSNVRSTKENDHLLAAWTIAGWGVMILFGVLLVLHQQSMQTPLTRPAVAISDLAIGGAAFGAVVGGFHVVTRDRQRELRSLNQAVEHAGHCVYITDTDGNIEYVNPAFEERTGYSAEEAVGKNADILNSGEHDSEFFEEMWNTILAGEVWEGEIINETKNCGLCHSNQTIAPVFDEDGEIERFVAINNDISEIKEYEQELENLTEQLEALNRVVRHDIRNDMNVVTGWACVLKDHVEEESARDAVDNILRSSQHVIELTEVAREYVESLAEEDTVATEPVRLEPVLNQCVMSRREVFPDATIEIDGDLPRVSVEANEMLSSVFRNLINNAIQHNDKDDPTVRVSGTVTDGTVMVAIADNGPGIPEQSREAIFGKGEQGIESEGTGIGLYLVNQLVENYGGDIQIESNDPEGTVFRIGLPKI